MKLPERYATPVNKVLRILPWIIILAGSVVRIAVWLQNRNLFIDEANVARNIYERGIGGLAMPLSYEQYAPPVFLWIIKLFASVFGYSEQALRLWPLLAGIGTLIVLWALLKELVSYRTLWYPLALTAVAFILIRYSAELKQYVPDALIVLSLLLLALKVNIFTTSKLRFTLLWFLAGSIAVWSSMPSVFALAGVGCYYSWSVVKERKWSFMPPVLIIAVLWIAQFAFYYLAILKPQANSDYLQNFHRGYFLFAIPHSKDELMHNWYLFRNLVQEAGGYAGFSWKFNTVMFVLGAAGMLYRHTARGLLLVVPVAATLLAAALHQFSLIPRVVIFMMPLILVLAGCGLEMLMSIRFLLWQLLLAFVCAKAVKDHNMMRMIWEPLKVEEITEEMSYVKAHNISGAQLYVHNGARPAFIYYTTIHPKKDQWRSLLGAHLLSWDANYPQLAQQAPEQSAFIYTSISTDELKDRKADVAPYLNLKAYREEDDKRCYVYIYDKK
ncbi:ArnT family glycosyltransferase [Chitinophagaceae bacterium MMS25-I14]